LLRATAQSRKPRALTGAAAKNAGVLMIVNSGEEIVASIKPPR